MTRKNSNVSTLLTLTPNKPIADGIRFCEMSLFDQDTQKMLAARGLIWLTEFDNDGTEMGGSVIAKDREQASEIADARGLGETVYGRMAGGDGMPHIPN